MQDEATTEFYTQNVTDELQQKFYQAMYDEIDRIEMYRLGVNRYVDRLRPLVAGVNHRLKYEDWVKCFYHFYNRQLIVQMTMTPKRFDKHFKDVDVPLKEIYVPLARAPNQEIQVDILRLLPSQLEANFKIKFMVVIMDPFSRFIWSFPVAKADSRKVLSAFSLALSRTGVAKRYYEFIRDKVQRVVVDGGGEFKAVFAENIHHIFPNAQIRVSDPKRKTHGRPTNTGPVEASIRTLRRVMRDFEIAIHPSFYHSREIRKQETKQGGLSRILKKYNSVPQTSTLQKKSPTQVVKDIMAGNDQATTTLQTHMDTRRNEKIEAKANQKAQLGGKYFALNNTHSGFAYRLFEPPGPFSKEAEIKVSLEMYVVTRVYDNHTQVDLREVNGTKTKDHQRMESLVLIKTPVQNGPQAILTNLKKEYQKYHMDAISKASAMRPYNVSDAIVRAVGGPHAGVVQPAINPIPVAPLAGHPVPHHQPVAIAPLGPQPFYNVPVTNDPTRRGARVRTAVQRYNPNNYR